MIKASYKNGVYTHLRLAVQRKWHHTGKTGILAHSKEWQLFGGDHKRWSAKVDMVHFVPHNWQEVPL